MGAEAIKELLQEIDLDKLSAELKEELSATQQEVLSTNHCQLTLTLAIRN